MKKTWLLALVLTGLSAGSAQARNIPEVRRFMTEEITRIAHALQESDGTMGSPIGPHSTYSNFQLSVFRLRIKAGIGFDVFFGRLTLEPQIELFWQ